MTKAANEVVVERRRAVNFVVLLGLVSLWADVTYEGARSVIGPFLATLGASGTVVGIVAGSGELLGYALRLLSGRIADRTRRYWALTLIGYGVNLLSVPALAFAGHWSAAAFLIVAERAGKAIRTPARDAMLSFATHATGRGWGFGLHEALDQVGATFGPLLVAALLGASVSYPRVFLFLGLPAMAALSLLLVARFLFPHPRAMEPLSEPLHAEGLPRRFWIYLLAASLVALGYTDYPLMAFHFGRVGHVPAAWIAVGYAVAMAVDGVAALAFGRWYDRSGIRVLAVSTLVTACFPFFAFAHSPGANWVGIVLWGAGMGAQESIFRAAVASMVAPSQRATAYGVFHLAYGVTWFFGSSLMGILYDRSLWSLVAFSAAVQWAAVPAFLVAARTPLPASRHAPPRRS